MTDLELLSELVARYGNMKSEMDSYKKQVDSDNKDIKSIMSSLDIPEVTSGGYIAKLTTSVSEDFDEEKLVATLLKIMNTDNPDDNPYLCKMYVPNMNAIENAIYNNILDASALANCKVKKETKRLTIKRKK